MVVKIWLVQVFKLVRVQLLALVDRHSHLERRWYVGIKSISWWLPLLLLSTIMPPFGAGVCASLVRSICYKLPPALGLCK